MSQFPKKVHDTRSSQVDEALQTGQQKNQARPPPPPPEIMEKLNLLEVKINQIMETQQRILRGLMNNTAPTAPIYPNIASPLSPVNVRPARGFPNV